MIPTHVIPYRHGELRIGWASWDNGTFTDRSIKWAYRDSSGKISRGSPELPFDILIDMIDLATAQGELKPFLQAPQQQPPSLTSSTKADLLEERKTLASRLVSIQAMMIDVPWGHWQAIYNQIGARLDAVKAEIATRP